MARIVAACGGRQVIRVVLAEHQALVLRALSALLSLEQGLRVVG